MRAFRAHARPSYCFSRNHSSASYQWSVELVSGAARSPPAALDALLLPEAYPASVAPSYLRYSVFAALGTVFSSAGGVLATQSLLQALGVGAAAAAPAAAATNWVLKDGLGQFGGMLYAAALGHRFDADPKRWRQVSALVQDAAGALEVCMALAPLPFLPAAALANVARNVAWLSASATRAGIHQAISLRGNLADVTARAGSQTTAAASLGAALGVGVAAALAAAPGAAGGVTSAATLLAYAALSLGHQVSVNASLRAVVLPTLTPRRLALAWGALPSLPAPAAGAHAPLTPAQVAAAEEFVPWPRAGGGGGTPPLQPLPQLAPPLGAGGTAALGAFVGACGRAAPTHVLRATAPVPAALQLFLSEGARGGDVVVAHLHAARAAWELGAGRAAAAAVAGEACSCCGGLPGGGAPCAQCALRAVQRAGRWAEDVAPAALRALQAAGWDVAQLAALEGPAERRVRLVKRAE